MIKKVKKIVVGAGGLGARFLPITSSLPKEMFPLIDRPVIQYVLEEGLVNGVEELILVVSKDKQVLLNYLKESRDKDFRKLLKNVKITIVYRQPKALGNAIAVLAAKNYLKDEPFLVLWADSFGLRSHHRVEDLLNTYLKVQRPIMCLIPFTDRARYLYAIPKIENATKNLVIVKRIFEKPGRKKIESPYAFANGYLLEPDILKYLEKTKPNYKGEIILEDAIDAYCQENLVYGWVFKKPLFEAGNKLDLVRTSLQLLNYRQDLKKGYNQILIDLKK